MKLIRVYADESGESHIEDMDLDMHDNGAMGTQSESWKVREAIFREIPPLATADFHQAPLRQLAVNLDGIAEIEVSDGTIRQVKPGDVFLVEDTTGKGHLNRFLDDKQHAFLFLPLE